MTGSAAAETSFATASDLLHELAAVRVNAKRVERVAEALGREVAAAEQAAVFDPQPPSRKHHVSGGGRHGRAHAPGRGWPGGPASRATARPPRARRSWS